MHAPAKRASAYRPIALALLAVALGVFLSPGAARADGDGPGKSSRFRASERGWFLGGDVAVGMVSYNYSDGRSNSENAWLLHVRFGGMLGQRLALSGEFWSDGHDYEGSNGAASTQNTFALALSYLIMPKLWVTTGLGSATVKGFDRGFEVWKEKGPAWMGGVGYEVFARRSYSIDITGRMINSWYDSFQRTNISFGVGATWH